MNSDKSHTPGPWTWSNDPYPNGDPYIHIIAGNGVALDGGFHITAIITEADGRLIAAAPDLLNALVVLADVAESRGIPVDAARAAIARAEGRS